ncbi:MAG: hypothetical protein OXF61_15880 [Acidimicrobiaceae bacterium]|nr:hypothetical protein [Acidimicrobiaceae bacterium]
MSEEDRSRLYAWLREQTDEPLAEYLMSCLPAAPLSDLVTKQHLEAVLSAKFSTFELNMAAQREADREVLAAQREADRKTLDQRLRRIAIALPFEIVVALAAVVAVTEWLRG